MTLEVRVVSEVHGGLRIVDHLPALRPCRLEGRNGIGKSALVRLLTLVSGTQPYPGDRQAWQSLKTLIGPTVLTITGLTGTFSTARIKLTPDRWPDAPQIRIGDWLGTVEVDEQSAEVSVLFNAFDVVHLTGTERLQDTLSHQRSRLAVALGEIDRQVEGLDSARAELGELSEQLEWLSPRQADEEHTARIDAQRQRRDIGTQLSSAVRRATDLTRASALRALLDSGDAAKQQEELKELRSRLTEVRNGLPAAEIRHETAVTALEAGTEAERRAARLERRSRTLSKKVEALFTRQGALAPRLASIEVPADAETLTEAQAVLLNEQYEAASLRREVERLRAVRARRSEAENNVLDEVRIVLINAHERGLGYLVLAYLNDRDISVDDLAAALGRVATLPNVTEEDLIDAEAEVAQWEELVEIFADKASLSADVRAVSEQLDTLASQVAGQDQLRMAASQAREALDAANAEVRALLSRIGTLSQSPLAGSEADDAETEVADLLSTHEVEPDGLLAALAQTQTDQHTLQLAARHLDQQVKDLDDNAALRRVQRDSLRRRASTDSGLAWLAELASTAETPADEPGEWVDETWQLLADHIRGVRQALSALSRDVVGLRAVAETRIEGSGTRLEQAVTAVIEQEALDQLSARPIANALFDGGSVQRVSLEDQSITWTTPRGEPRTRPLSVFSSGEQALGFIRARLQQIADVPSANRLIVLDEFGAFIAADRRKPLATLLTTDDLLALTDQVVVVLPLQADYEAELGDTTGELHDLYARRARDIAERGYFTEEFVR